MQALWGAISRALIALRNIRAMKNARFLIFPSEWYETFGMTLVESFACGTMVVCSKLGAMEEIVDDGRTGLHFAPETRKTWRGKWSGPSPTGRNRGDGTGGAARIRSPHYTAHQGLRTPYGNLRTNGGFVCVSPLLAK